MTLLRDGLRRSASTGSDPCTAGEACSDQTVLRGEQTGACQIHMAGAETISLKGEVKKTHQFQVRIGPDGQRQKTEFTPPGIVRTKRRKNEMARRRKENRRIPSLRSANCRARQAILSA